MNRFYAWWLVKLGRAIDIWSKCKYPACVLSNLHDSIFIFDDVECHSMEGFLQSLKYKDEKSSVRYARRRDWMPKGSPHQTGRRIKLFGGRVSLSIGIQMSSSIWSRVLTPHCSNKTDSSEKHSSPLRGKGYFIVEERKILMTLY